MLKRIIFLLFAFTAVVSAQVRPGLKLGYNLGGVNSEFVGVYSYDITGKPSPNHPNAAGYPQNFKMISGFQIGMIADCPINDAFAIQPGARFAMQGFIDEYRSGAAHIRRFSLFYLQVPVYAQYRWNVAEETNVLFQAGPYAGIGLFGRQSHNTGGSNQDLDHRNKTINFREDFDKALDYGISIGAGIEFYRFQLVAAYDFGLNKANFKKNQTGYLYNLDMRNHCFSVTLAVIFGRRDPLFSQRDF